MLLANPSADLGLLKVHAQRTHRRISWDLVTGSEYCLAGDHGFAEDKGDWWMTEDSYVDTRVREFADHIQCNPELAYISGFLI